MVAFTPLCLPRDWTYSKSPEHLETYVQVMRRLRLPPCSVGPGNPSSSQVPSIRTPRALRYPLPFLAGVFSGALWHPANWSPCCGTHSPSCSQSDHP